jgi:Fur family iron response transcriptional regulator
MSSVSKHDCLDAFLQGAGLRPTRQRLALGAWLFDGCDKHVTAEQVHEAVLKTRTRVSLATVYNTLNIFTGAGLLRQIVIDGGQVYFDTNVSDHHHVFDETDRCLSDIPAASVRIASLPKLPDGKKLAHLDLVLRIRSEN